MTTESQRMDAGAMVFAQPGVIESPAFKVCHLYGHVLEGCILKGHGVAKCAQCGLLVVAK